MARISVVLGAVMVILCSNIVQARMYFLPDYQTGAYLKRSNDSALGQSISSSGPKSCADLSGFISADQKGNMDCNVVKSVPGVGVCYSDCYCNTSTYKYSTSNCSYTLTGDTCVSDKFYYTECRKGCEHVTHQSCSYGCQATHPECSSKCKTCYSDNCRNRTSKSCDYGCQSYYADCSSKCESCKTCAPTNCSAYTLSSCPANAICDSCTVGCGNNTLKYKFAQCEISYINYDNYWCGYNLNAIIEKLKGDLL